LNFYNPNHTPNAYNYGGEVDLVKLSSSLWRGKWFILICILFCLAAADFYVRHIAVPLYSATVKIALEEGQSRKILTEIESVTSDDPITDIGINTELEVLRSHDLIGQLVDTLELINKPDFNEYLQKASLFSRLLTKLLAFFGAPPGEAKSIPALDKIRSSAMNSVLKVMKFSNTQNTRVINISVTTTEAALSVLMANTMAELYIEKQIQVKLDLIATATKFLSTRTSELKYDFEELKIELANFSSQSELINPTIFVAQEIKLRDLRTRLFEAKKVALKKNNRRTILKSHRADDNLQALINTADDFRLNRVISQYSDNKISLAELNMEVDYFILNIEAEAEREQKQLLALQVSESTLAKQIEQQSQELIVLQQLERETEAARLLYESFFTRLLEMNVQIGLETSDGRILSRATQRGQSSPIKIRILSNAAIIGLMIAASLLLIREMRFSGFRSINELQNNTGYSVLASVPLIPKRERKTIISYLREKPYSVVSEAVRNLRTSILMSNSDRIPKVIMLTSSVPKEGKTVLTFALAQNMVGLGKRVLLIEADIRRLAHSVNINRENTVALLDLLTGDKKFKDESPFFFFFLFDILTAEKRGMNAADLFSSQRFSELLAELREHYDFILVDSPPVLSVPDARVIGANTDANIYIVEWNKTTRSQVEQGLEMLSSVGVNVTGLVLNQIDPYKIKAYNYISQYGYNEYGSEYYEN
jgi:capsular exopolysaccharide synthesis family protein